MVRIITWMLLWAKKGHIAEWKLTSTFFHPNCCKPLIISSVNKTKYKITPSRHSERIRFTISPLSIDASTFTFHNFMILYCILCAWLILRCLLCFSCFWRKMWAIGGDWRAIVNIYNMLITIQRPARWLWQWHYRLTMQLENKLK